MVVGLEMWPTPSALSPDVPCYTSFLQPKTNHNQQSLPSIQTLNLKNELEKQTPLSTHAKQRAM